MDKPNPNQVVIPEPGPEPEPVLISEDTPLNALLAKVVVDLRTLLTLATERSLAEASNERLTAELTRRMNEHA